jgi:hypothetical protein
MDRGTSDEGCLGRIGTAVCHKRSLLVLFGAPISTPGSLAFARPAELDVARDAKPLDDA